MESSCQLTKFLGHGLNRETVQGDSALDHDPLIDMWSLPKVPDTRERAETEIPGAQH